MTTTQQTNRRELALIIVTAVIGASATGVAIAAVWFMFLP